MYKGGIIILGLLFFVLLFTIPFWMNIYSGTKAEQPVLVYPEGYDECVAEKEYMKAFHMDVLDEWRDKVVRQNIRFTNMNGHKVEMSLSKTCMGCHTNKEEFCDRCHDYLGVVPYCWDCHVMPQEVKNKQKLELSSIISNEIEAAKEAKNESE